MLRNSTAALTLIGVPALLFAGLGKAPVPGEPAPDFAMISIAGQPVKLSEKLAGGDTNIVLVFSRANW